MAKNTICLWYDKDAEAAARFYTKTFPDSAMGRIFRAPSDYPSGKKGDVVAQIRKLRQQPGRTVHTWGSTEALQTLLKNDLIDEYRLFICPVVLGSGKRLFGSGTVPAALKQVESVTTGKGATYHRFERGGKPEYGQMGT